MFGCMSLTLWADIAVAGSGGSPSLDFTQSSNSMYVGQVV